MQWEHIKGVQSYKLYKGVRHCGYNMNLCKQPSFSPRKLAVTNHTKKMSFLIALLGECKYVTKSSFILPVKALKVKIIQHTESTLNSIVSVSLAQIIS